MREEKKKNQKKTKKCTAYKYGPVVVDKTDSLVNTEEESNCFW